MEPYAFMVVGLLLLASLGFALMSAQLPNDKLDKASLTCSGTAIALMFVVMV